MTVLREAVLRDATEQDFATIVDLNDAEVAQTSRMDVDRLDLLVRLSSHCKVAVHDDRVAAFVIALRDGLPYENENYAWFAARYERFLYVDRIVVDAGCAGLGIGSALYRDLFVFAAASEIPVVACEYNIEPPNVASRAFHDRFGFREVGTQWVAAGTKRVSMQVSIQAASTSRLARDDRTA